MAKKRVDEEKATVVDENEAEEKIRRTQGNDTKDEPWDDPTWVYLNEIGRFPLLTFEQEQDLAKRAKRGDERALLRIAECNLKWVVSLAKSYSGRGVDLNDLIAEGNFGLLRAVEKFDPKKGFRFSTYSTAWIRQAITRAIERTGRTIRLPSWVYQLNSKLKKCLQKDPTLSIEELAKKAKSTPDNVVFALDVVKIVMLPIEDEEDGKVRSYLETQESADPDPALEAERKDQTEKLNMVLEAIPKKERNIIKKRLGFGKNKPMTLEAIGRQFHVTRERIRQLEAKGFKDARIAAIRLGLEEYFNEWLREIAT